MKTYQSVYANSAKKRDRILDALKNDGRLGHYEEFWGFEGPFYMIWYRVKGA